VSEESEIIVGLLQDILGDERLHYEGKGQISFDCPVCAMEKDVDGDGKGNLEVNYFRHVYKCWACGETHGTQGPLIKLVEQFGTKPQQKTYKILQPEGFKKTEVKKNKLKLPPEFIKFKDSNPVHIAHKQAYNYLSKRGITDKIINYWDIGYCGSGEYANRIIVPSYDENGKLNYFLGRSWLPNKIKYKNPAVPKDEIIFNENKIDWFKPVYLVEGVFDAFFLDNAIPMLGKHMSNKLMEKVYDNALNGVVIALDGDAWTNATKIFNILNGGRLLHKVKIVHLPKDKDICDLQGKIDEYYVDLIK